MGLEFLGFQALLLCGEHLVRDEPLVGELYQAGLVVGEFLDLALVAFDVLLHDHGALVGVAAHIGPYRLSDQLGQVDAAVVLGDLLLDLGDRVVPAVTATTLLAAETLDAAEVLIHPAIAAMTTVEQSPAALGAVERSAEVVLVLVRPITGDRPGSEERLHLIEGVRIYQARVASIWHAHSPVDNHSHVVGVAQHFLNRVGLQRSRALLGCLTTLQSSALQMLRQAASRPVAGRVQVERFLDERCALFVRDHRANILVANQFALRQIPDGGLKRCAAIQMLLVQPLLDLGGEIVGVVLRERGKHPVHQPSGGRLVDVLGSRDEGDAHADQALIQLSIIQPVTSQSVHLVDDDVLDAECQ